MQRIVCLFLCLFLSVPATLADEPPLPPGVLEAIKDVRAHKDFLAREWEKDPEYLNDRRLLDAMCLEVEHQTEAVIEFWTETGTDPILYCCGLAKLDKAEIQAWAVRALEKINAFATDDPEQERMREKFVIGVKGIQEQTR